MKLSSVSLRNIRCFESYNVDFKSPYSDTIPQICALIGANGAGKTTILQSIVSTFSLIDPSFKGTIFDNTDILMGSENASIDLELVFNKQELDELQPDDSKNLIVSSGYYQKKHLNFLNNTSYADIRFPDNFNIPIERVSTLFRNNDLQNTFSVIKMLSVGNTMDFITNGDFSEEEKNQLVILNQFRNYNSLLNYINKNNRCLIIYIDAFRHFSRNQPLFPDYDNELINSKECSLKSSVVDDKISKRYFNLKQWLINLDYSHIKDKDDKHIKTVYNFLIKTCNRFFNEFEYQGINKKGSVLFKEKGGRNRVLDLNSLSDGFKSVFLIVGEIIQRLSLAYHTNEESDMDFYEGEAVVLIDEIDCHMHPKWQKKFIPTLKELFPNCQFIVTTHSPYILDTLQPDEIIRIGDRDYV